MIRCDGASRWRKLLPLVRTSEDEPEQDPVFIGYSRNAFSRAQSVLTGHRAEERTRHGPNGEKGAAPKRTPSRSVSPACLRPWSPEPSGRGTSDLHSKDDGKERTCGLQIASSDNLPNLTRRMQWTNPAPRHTLRRAHSEDALPEFGQVGTGKTLRRSSSEEALPDCSSLLGRQGLSASALDEQSTSMQGGAQMSARKTPRVKLRSAWKRGGMAVDHFTTLARGESRQKLAAKESMRDRDLQDGEVHEPDSRLLVQLDRIDRLLTESQKPALTSCQQASSRAACNQIKRKGAASDTELEQDDEPLQGWNTPRPIAAPSSTYMASRSSLNVLRRGIQDASTSSPGCGAPFEETGADLTGTLFQAARLTETLIKATEDYDLLCDYPVPRTKNLGGVTLGRGRLNIQHPPLLRRLRGPWGSPPIQSWGPGSAR